MPGGLAGAAGAASCPLSVVAAMPATRADALPRNSRRLMFMRSPRSRVDLLQSSKRGFECRTAGRRPANRQGVAGDAELDDVVAPDQRGVGVCDVFSRE